MKSGAILARAPNEQEKLTDFRLSGFGRTLVCKPCRVRKNLRGSLRKWHAAAPVCIGELPNQLLLPLFMNGK
jgi:hypothetical protein